MQDLMSNTIINARQFAPQVLQARQQGGGYQPFDGVAAADVDVEAGAFGHQQPSAGSGGDTQKSRDMAAFFQQVNAVKRDIDDVGRKQAGIAALHERHLTAIRRQDAQDAQAQLQAALEDTRLAMLRAKQGLCGIEELNAAALKVPGQELGSANERTRSSLTAGLRKKLLATVNEFAGLRARIQEEHRQDVARRLYAVTGEQLPDEHVDQVIESGQADAIFQRAILEQGRGRVLDVVADVEQRHVAFKHLEQSLLEMHQQFCDVAVLIEAQGPHLDSIEKQVQRAGEHVEHGATQLAKAKVLQRNMRRWKLYTGLGTGAVVVILIIVIVLSTRGLWAPK